jgi:hypothetical protein
MILELLLSAVVQASPSSGVVARCEVRDDPQARVYELRRGDGADGARWWVEMRSRESGDNPVRLPMPDAAPVFGGGTLSLEYRTQNGGRDVAWKVGPSGASLDLHANYELEVNIEPDLDPRVELMNTDGPITTLACSFPK